MNLTDALQWTGPSPSESEFTEERADLERESQAIGSMSLEDFVEHTMHPNDTRADVMQWTFAGLGKWAAQRADTGSTEAIVSNIVLKYMRRAGLDTEDLERKKLDLKHVFAAALSKVVKYGLKKVVKRFLKWAFKKLMRIALRAVRTAIRAAFRTAIRWVVRPIIVGALEFLGLNPELWPFVALAGGFAAAGYFVWDKFFSGKVDRSVSDVDSATDWLGIPTQQTSEAGAPIPAGATAVSNAPVVQGATGSLGALISRGEGDYNSVNLGKAHGYLPSHEDLVNMTLSQVMAHQEAKDFNAAGRYQITRDTLKDAKRALGLTGAEKFDTALQDRIFNAYLIGTRRAGISKYIRGETDDLYTAQLQASMEWASVAAPDGATLYKGGRGDGKKSYYADTANNKASITSAEFAAAINQQRADYAASQGHTAADSPAVTTKAGTMVDATTQKSKQQQQQRTAGGSAPQPPDQDKVFVLGPRGEIIAVNP